jgi:protein SCO1
MSYILAHLYRIRSHIVRRIATDRDITPSPVTSITMSALFAYLKSVLRHAGCWLAAGVLAASLGACQKHADWQLTDVNGHLPDLNFSLISDDNQPVTQAVFKGDIVLVYFGYTFCPDICPATMARLTQAVQQLGPAGQHVRIAFITVDPRRDTAQALHAYVKAFDAEHAVGLTGSNRAIEELARRYRVAFELEKPRADGSYDVTHSSAIYIFDGAGHARLIATDGDSIAALVHDLRMLAAQAA